MELNSSDWISFIALVISIIFSGITIVQTQKSNNKSEIANNLAFDANRQSIKANDLSENANKIANQALELAKIQEIRATTHEVIDWRFDIDKDWTITITNIGTNVAHNVTVLIQIYPEQELIDRAEWRYNDARNGIDRTAPNEQIIFTSDNVANVRDEARTKFGSLIGSIDNLDFFPDGQAHGEIFISIFWENSVGIHSKKEFKKHID